MSREEAIARLKVLTDYEYDEDLEALEMAIEALEQEHCEDCVSRRAVIEITAETGALETQARVRALPPVTPKEKTGWCRHWAKERGDADESN